MSAKIMEPQKGFYNSIFKSLNVFVEKDCHLIPINLVQILNPHDDSDPKKKQKIDSSFHAESLIRAFLF